MVHQSSRSRSRERMRRSRSPRPRPRLARSDDEEEGAWTELLRAPANEAGVFYNQIQDEIQMLRSRVDSKLQNMIAGGMDDVRLLNSQLAALQAEDEASQDIFVAADTGLFTNDLQRLQANLTPASSKLSGTSFDDLHISSSAATEQMTNLTAKTTARRLGQVNFPGDDNSLLEENSSSRPRNRLRPQRKKKKKGALPQALVSPQDAVTNARKMSRDDAITEARYDRESPLASRRRFFPDNDSTIPLASGSSEEDRSMSPMSRAISRSSSRSRSRSEQPSSHTSRSSSASRAMSRQISTAPSNLSSARSPSRSRAPSVPPTASSDYGAAMVPAESSRSPYADEIRDAVRESYRQAYQVPLTRTASEVRRSIGGSQQGSHYAATYPRAIDRRLMEEEETSGSPKAPDPDQTGISKSKKNGKATQKDSASQNHEKQLDLLLESLAYLDENVYEKKSDGVIDRLIRDLGEEKKDDDAMSVASYASQRSAAKSMALHSIAQSSVTDSFALSTGHNSEKDLLAELASSAGPSGVVKVEKVQGQRIIDPYGDEGRFTGLLVKGRPYGHGTMHYNDGRSYTGEWKNGRWHGRGRTLFVNGDFFVGEYIKDQRHGLGRYEWSDGRVYDGQFYKDQREGRGTYSWPDGAIYTGDFKNGHRHGQGCYKFKDGSVYTGEFKDGRYHGVGECVWSDGRCYRGEWSNGHANGYGMEMRPDGTIRHDGEWKNDRPVRDGKSVKQEKKAPPEPKRRNKMPESERGPRIRRPTGSSHHNPYRLDP